MKAENAYRSNKRRGSLFVVSAPSGAGKTSLCRMLCNKTGGIKHSVSYTTREPRNGEINDIDYTFIDKKEFLQMVREGEFIEWAEVYGNYYGTSARRIEEAISAGIDIIMDIDTQGAKQLMEKKADATYIFILPPSLEELRNRLVCRNTDSGEVISKRLQRAVKEIRDYNLYKYVIINDSIEYALDDLSAVVRSERCRMEKIDEIWIKETFLKEVG
ncbi:guanylate kinase [bacterium BMS3Abin07]|nr:guanylate kinase [bacterium BMS3Abin07]GBE33455.1 guanylate kinase [bacterium BMS3Bbin05]HDO22737.1 guanylate kinase [Nitrospirota bacterium]